LPFALSIARRAGATLKIVHVHEAGAPRLHGKPLPIDAELDLQSCIDERAYLNSVSQRLTTSEDGPITTTLLEGPVAETLLDYISKRNVDLVVMITHGRGGFSSLFLGSVADRVMRHAPVPVLLIRPCETSSDLPREAVFAHLLIPLDGSALSEQILASAVELGRLMDAEYTLIQAIDPLIASYGPETYALTEHVLDQWMKDSRAYLDRQAAPLRVEGLRVKTEVVVGAPAYAILDYARARGIDLIAMETHGRSGFSRLFLGSVADKVVRGAHTPVLLQHPEMLDEHTL
jgi:nucleotide-binding universal stress UspA family protein